MPKYVVKLTENKGRHSITIPVELIRKRRLAAFEYLVIDASDNKPIKIRGLEFNEKTK